MKLASYFDSQQSRKVASLIVKRGRILGLLLYLVGLVYLCILPNEDLTHRSFFDENALMAGLVKREFGDINVIMALATEMESINNQDEGILWLENWFSRVGLEVYRQNFTATKPVSYSSESSQISGTNVYGILRASRSFSAEAMVFSTPCMSQSGGNVYGNALVLALAEYFKTKNYWAKDFIFLVTSQDEIGMQAWVDGYMGLQTTGIAAGSLPGRSGAIQAVINLEVPSPSVHYADIIVEGVNGILPNLDLVNLVSYSCKLENIRTAFHTQWMSRSGKLSPSDRHYLGLRTMLAMAAHQAPGLPLANHGLFLRHRIDSLTLRGVGSPNKDPRSLLNLGRALEGTFRSVNNLLETLHHSEFFYYMPSPDRFISIGRYMPLFGFLLAPVVIEALAQWLLVRIPGLLGSAPAKDSTGLPVLVPFPFQAIMQLLLVSFMCGLMVYAAPSLATSLQGSLKAEGLVASLIGACGVSMLIPLIFRTLVDSEGWRMAKAFGLILLLLLLTAIAMMNYSLAVLLALTLPIPAVVAQPCVISGRGRQLLRIACTLLFSPPLCLLYLCCAYTLFTSSTAGDSLSNLASAGLERAVEGTVFAYNSWYLVGSWVYLVSCLFVWPVWLMSWVLCCQSVRSGCGSTNSDPHPHSD